MDLADLLRQAGVNDVTAQAPEGFDPGSQFGQVAGMIPKDLLAGGLAEAFRSDQTPPFASMLGGLFGNSNSGQQASVLNSLLAVVGPILLQRMMGGGGSGVPGGGGGGLGDVLGAVLGGGGGGGASSQGGGLGDILGAVLGGGNRGGGGGGGTLESILGQMMQGGGGLRQLTDDEASQFSAEDVQALAQEAAQQDPSIIDRLSELYAENPDVVKSLDSGSLMLALSKIAQSAQR